MLNSKEGAFIMIALIVCSTVLVFGGYGWWAALFLGLAATARFREK